VVVQLLQSISAAGSVNKSKLLTSGVWRYTSPPNYFADAAQWWAYYLLALAAGGWFPQK
jgi:steroid 5-alpha reductase family enzyme